MVFKKRLFMAILRPKLASCGRKTVIHPSCEIRKPGKISIGDNTNINHGSELYGGGGISIGSNTMLAYGVFVFSDSRKFMGETPLREQKGRIEKPVSIGDDVWIGARATIMPGVKIGNHAIVAAGSVVTKNVEEWAIVGGNPAKVIGNRLKDQHPNEALISATEIDKHPIS